VTTLCLTVIPPPFQIVPPKISYKERGGDVNVAGKIGDAFRGPLSKAAVVLVNSATGLSYVTETDESGEFQFKDIDPGRYQLRTTYDNRSRTLATFLVARENLTRIDGVCLFSEEKYTKVCPAEVPLPLIPPK
jgi:protocatechuate 3,4-dioxygenase beta subunit